MEAQRFLNSVKSGDRIEGFYSLKNLRVRTTANGKDYLDVLIADSTQAIPAKWWDLPEEMRDWCKRAEESGEQRIGKIRGLVELYNSKKQIKLMNFRFATENDHAEIQTDNLVQKAPAKSDALFRHIMEKFVEDISDAGIHDVCAKALKENQRELLYYPAAEKIHHAYQSGLLYHMAHCLKMAKYATQTYSCLNKDLLYAGALLHDIGKLKEMDASEIGTVKYTPTGNLIGHVVLGADYVNRLCKECFVDDETRSRLVHIILSHHGKRENGSPVRPAFPEAEVVSTLDGLDMNLDIFERVTKDLTPGEVTNSTIWELENRRVYRAK